MRVLVVEDDMATSLVVSRLLELQGHKVVTARTGHEALDLFHEQRFDVVLSDWVMDGMDGIDLLRQLRLRENSKYVYFVMLTAMSHQHDRMQALTEGADDMMTKPFDPAELVARLQVAERILRMRQELEDRTNEHHQLTEILEMSNRRVAELFKGLPIACISIAQDGAVMEFNRAAEILFGRESHEVWMQPLWNVIASKKEQKFAKELAWAALGSNQLENEPWEHTLRTGQMKYLLVSSFPMRSVQGAVIGASIACVDITEIKALENQLTEQLTYANQLSTDLEQKNNELGVLNEKYQQLASTDGLTGLFNNRTFKEKLQEAMDLAREEGTPLSVMITDVDKFKSFNDEFGHLVGDEVLRRVASVLRTVGAEHEPALVARYGGEEFVAILPGFGEEGATAFAEEVRVRIESEPWTWRQVTSSFGVATFDGSENDLNAFVGRADEALYYSKERGRNQVTHYRFVRKRAA